MTYNSRVRRAFVAPSAMLAAAGALIFAGVLVAPVSAGNPATFGINGGLNVFNAPSIGYPAPGGIYAPFTDCPINNPVMQLSVPNLATGCVASENTSGTFTIHGIPVAITHPVTVQFGFYSALDSSGNQVLTPVMPADGRSLQDLPEEVPGGLSLLLLCPNGINADIARLCKQAATSGLTDLTALVLPAGPISNFGLTSFTQPVKIQLINPLLGGNCFIGSDDDPIVLNPTIISGTLAFVPDPDPVRFPTTVVLEVLDAVATDDTFTVPVARGCGPGDVADDAINFLLGLPSPSGTNSLVLNGNSLLADDFSAANQIDSLKAAFKASGM